MTDPERRNEARAVTEEVTPRIATIVLLELDVLAQRFERRYGRRLSARQRRAIVDSLREVIRREVGAPV